MFKRLRFWKPRAWLAPGQGVPANNDASPFAVIRRGSPNPEFMRPNRRSPEAEKAQLREFCKNTDQMAVYYEQYPLEAPTGFWEAIREPNTRRPKRRERTREID